MIYLTKFLSEHPTFQKISDLEDKEQEIVRWASNEGYARIELAPGDVEVVSKHQLKKAKMWWKKMHG